MFSSASTSAVDTAPMQIIETNWDSNSKINRQQELRQATSVDKFKESTNARKLLALRSDSLGKLRNPPTSPLSKAVNNVNSRNNLSAVSVASSATSIESKNHQKPQDLPNETDRISKKESLFNSPLSQITKKPTSATREQPSQTSLVTTARVSKPAGTDPALDPNANNTNISLTSITYEILRLSMTLLNAMILGLFVSVILYRSGFNTQIDDRIGKQTKIIGLHIEHFVLYMLILQAVNFFYGWFVMAFDFASQFLYFAILIVLIDIGNMVALNFLQYLYFHIFLVVYAFLALGLWFLARAQKTKDKQLSQNNNPNPNNNKQINNKNSTPAGKTAAVADPKVKDLLVTSQLNNPSEVSGQNETVAAVPSQPNITSNI